MTEDRAQVLAEIADVAARLTDRFQHRQPYEVWDHNRHRKTRYHVTTHEGLLAQLRAMIPVRPQSDGTGGGKGEPPTPLNMEAASASVVITLHAFRWCNRLNVEQRDTVEGNVRALVGAAGSTTSDLQVELLRDMRGWERKASVLTGWATAPFRPRASCPHCNLRDLLVVNLDAKSAFCANEECGAAWREHGDADYGSIYVLAEHIRQETGSEGTAA